MADLLLAALPFTGHVTPICAVAEALVARGHDVRVYTGSAFRAQVEAVGATLVAWRAAPDFDENDLAATFPRLVGTRGLRQVLRNVVDCIIGTGAAQVDDLEAEWRRRPWRAMAADEVSVGVMLFAERHPVPWTTIAVLPLQLPSRHGPPSGLAVPPGASPLGRLRDAALRAVVPVLVRPLTRALDRQRAAAGLGTSRVGFDRVLFSPDSVVASGVPALDFDRPRPERVEYVGRLTRRTGGVAAPAWWSDLDGRRVVHITQGTQNTAPTDLIAPALRALADEDVLVVVTTGRGGDRLPFPTPQNARVAGFVSYADLLPRVDLMITNGGWGGTVGALAHGIPLIVAGGDLDKPDIAVRVAWSGAGVNLRTGAPTAELVAAAYRRVTDDPSFGDAARRIGGDIRRRGGSARAAELIEGRMSPAGGQDPGWGAADDPGRAGESPPS